MGNCANKLELNRVCESCHIKKKINDFPLYLYQHGSYRSIYCTNCNLSGQSGSKTETKY